MEKNFIAGGISGIFEVLITHPIDYLKVKKQEFRQLNKNFIFKEIKYNECVKSIIPRLLGVAPMRIIFWGAQDNTKLLLENNNIKSNYNFIVIGIVSGFFQSILDNPIEVIKIGTMTNQNSKDIFKSTINFKGFNATLLRNTGFTICMSYFCFNDNGNNKVFNSILGGLSGSILTQPLDFVKTQQQRSNDTRNIIKIIKDTMRESPKKLFVGGYYRCLLSISSMSIGFIFYDYFKNFLN